MAEAAPRLDAPAGAAPSSPQEAPDLRPRVLVVDDRSENLFAMKSILADLDVAVVTADSGQEALRCVLHHDFAVILMDVQMPEMDGFEAASLIRSNAETRTVPIIFVTAISKEDRYVFEGYEAGAVDYLFKPIEPRVLLAKVRVFTELYEGRQALARAHAEVKAEIERREAVEADLRLAQKLEAIGQLAAGIAHEINTPIQYIGDNTTFIRSALEDYGALLGKYAELRTAAKEHDALAALVEEVEAAEEEADLEYLSAETPSAIEQILQGVRQVSKIVRAMRDFSHPGSEEKSPVDLNRALENTVIVARNNWKYVAEVELELDEQLPHVMGHGSELNQVFLNLLVNAAHAIGDVVGDSGNKGRVGVATSHDETHVEIRISDSGTGIPEEVQGRVFDPFFTTKEVGKGTGQGLAIGRTIVVDKHDGTLSFETEAGKGTTFVIRLPKVV